jgi:flagellar biosynthesis protein FliQ
MEVAFVFVALFIIIFGIFYLHFTTRNKERLALIEKGGDASMFFGKKPKRSGIVGKMVVLNFATLLIGVGLGVFVGGLLQTYTTIQEEVGFIGSIFLFAGIGLLVGFYLTKKLIDKD